MATKSDKQGVNKKIANERIGILFTEAEKEFAKHPERSKRYIELASKIGMRYNVRLSKERKMKRCPKCMSYLKPGINCRVRTNAEKQAVIVTCISCRHISRYPYIREKRIIKKREKQ
ncbi:MAG: ribonuclease P [Candidatus Aenigmarchaeota archaeon]|nr:ribonuclease P [Candidatus Aenigmarchaeota archaeon]